MNLPWFRLYHEFADDPKVQMMSEQMQRRLVMLFCTRAKNQKLTETEMAFQWRIEASEVLATKKHFIERGFIDEDWNVINWNKRQFISDGSTARVQKHRAKIAMKQSETLHETHHVTEDAVTVTAPEQNRTDSETDQKKKEHLPPAVIRLPALGGSYPVIQSQIDHWKELYPAVEVLPELRKMVGWLEANGTRRKTQRGTPKFINSWLSRAQDKPHSTTNGGTNVGFAKGYRSPAKQRVDGNRLAIAEALAARGVRGPWDSAGANGSAISEPRPSGDDGGISSRLRKAGPEILPPED